MIKTIGLTGGIGSGKSTVARIFQSFGYAVYFSDDRAKRLTEEDPQVVSDIQEAFGTEMYDASGNLNRKALAAVVFSDPEQLAILNSIVHPAVFRDGAQWQQDLEQSGYDKPFSLREAAILFESGSHKLTDGIVSIYAPKNIRLERVTRRDKNSRDQVLARMANQFSDQYKIRHADFVIYNDGVHLLIPQVQRAIEYFLHESTS